MFPTVFVAGGVSWLSWRLRPAWGSTLPVPLLAVVALALTGGVVYLAFFRPGKRRTIPAPYIGRPLIWGAAIGLGGWFAAFMVEFGLGPSAVSEKRLLSSVGMPRGFVAYDWGFQGHDVGANVYYVGPSDALVPEAVEVPEAFSPLPYPASIQVYPEGWRPLARWGGRDPFGSGRCELSMDVARPDVRAYDLEGLDEADVAGIREGSMRAVYLVAYCG